MKVLAPKSWLWSSIRSSWKKKTCWRLFGETWLLFWWRRSEQSKIQIKWNLLAVFRCCTILHILYTGWFTCNSHIWRRPSNYASDEKNSSMQKLRGFTREAKYMGSNNFLCLGPNSFQNCNILLSIKWDRIAKIYYFCIISIQWVQKGSDELLYAVLVTRYGPQSVASASG